MLDSLKMIEMYSVFMAMIVLVRCFAALILSTLQGRAIMKKKEGGGVVWSKADHHHHQELRSRVAAARWFAGWGSKCRHGKQPRGARLRQVVHSASSLFSQCSRQLSAVQEEEVGGRKVPAGGGAATSIVSVGARPRQTVHHSARAHLSSDNYPCNSVVSYCAATHGSRNTHAQINIADLLSPSKLFIHSKYQTKRQYYKRLRDVIKLICSASINILYSIIIVIL